jgi:DNA-binding CsgD family transcriptional regulator
MRAGDGQLLWQTPLARRLLAEYLGMHDDLTPPRLIDWLIEAQQAARENREPPLLASLPNRRLLASLHDPSKLGQEGETDEKEWLLVLREENHQATITSLIATFRLTQREAEVLFWVCKGKTNKDIGEILDTSPRTVNKHLEHVFEKLGVETRTAAANLAMSKMG